MIPLLINLGEEVPLSYLLGHVMSAKFSLLVSKIARAFFENHII